MTKKGPSSLFAVTLGVLKWPLLSVIIPRAGLIGFTFCQPFLINRAITLAMQPVTEHTTNMGYGLIGAYVIVYVGISVSLHNINSQDRLI